jgi:hypothetical protein
MDARVDGTERRNSALIWVHVCEYTIDYDANTYNSQNGKAVPVTGSYNV